MSFVSKLKGAISQVKDAGASIALEHFLARQLEAYGELKVLNINSRDKSIHVEVLLKGEREPLAVDILEYELVTSAGEDFLVAKKAAASREWITVLLQSHLVGRKNPIPHQYSRMVRMVLNG